MRVSKVQFEESEILKEVSPFLSKNTFKQYRITLRQFLRYLASKHGLSDEERKTIESGKDLDSIIENLKPEVKETQHQIDNFYRWLMNEQVEGYELRGKGMAQSSAHAKAYSALRGLFVNMDIHFERKWLKSIPKAQVGKTLKKDNVYTFYDVDEKTRSIRFNRERMQQFLANLKLRDQAITLALLSSSQDSGDLFKLNIGDVRNQTNNRIFLEGHRSKTKVPFRTFFSKEATRFIHGKTDFFRFWTILFNENLVCQNSIPMNTNRTSES